MDTAGLESVGLTGAERLPLFIVQELYEGGHLCSRRALDWHGMAEHLPVSSRLKPPCSKCWAARPTRQAFPDN